VELLFSKRKSFDNDPRAKQLPSSVVIFSATLDLLPGVILDNEVLLAVQQRAIRMHL
jgi:hypothetical protein